MANLKLAIIFFDVALFKHRSAVCFVGAVSIKEITSPLFVFDERLLTAIFLCVFFFTE